ncbi:rCG23621 [Rattus norvegicus]|uniref:RCG23621 n=1 Tax=Rattus norvegicus TaxID=10116 RepID=A6KPP9_RAT|nr:rCG23621 [Rattus norvegicus]
MGLPSGCPPVYHRGTAWLSTVEKTFELTVSGCDSSRKITSPPQQHMMGETETSLGEHKGKKKKK